MQASRGLFRYALDHVPVGAGHQQATSRPHVHPHGKEPGPGAAHPVGLAAQPLLLCELSLWPGISACYFFLNQTTLLCVFMDSFIFGLNCN